MTPEKLLEKANWNRVRNRKHQVWRCPCGEHQVAFPSTPSDRRGPRNTISNIRRTECPSLKVLEPEVSYPWDKDADLCCFICKKSLDVANYKKEWVYHTDEHRPLFACLHHPGINKWHKRRCREKKAS